MKPSVFKKKVYEHYRKQGRDNLPWRKTHDPYKILISEIMLQQTQVSRVLVKYQEFLKRFPTLKALRDAKIAEVLALWQGLGYNRRALLLKKLAQSVKTKLPTSYQELLELPGIGPATAAAVAAFAYNEPTIYLDTNVRSVFIHEFFKDAERVSDAEIIPLIVLTLDKRDPRTWYYALLDYGNSIKKQINPSRKSTAYAKQSTFKGSQRQLRGEIVRKLLEKPLSLEELAQTSLFTKKNIQAVVDRLKQEGFLKQLRNKYRII